MNRFSFDCHVFCKTKAIFGVLCKELPMSVVRVSCPHCSFTREVSFDKLPEQPVNATCPKCKQVFQFQRPAVASSSPPDPPQDSPLLSMSPPPLPPPLPKPASSTRPQAGRSMLSRDLLSVGDLFTTTWELYKQRWLLLIGIFLATGIACVVPPMLVTVVMGSFAKGSFGGTVALIMAFGIALVITFTIVCWGMAAAVSAAVDEKLGFNDAFTRAKGCWISLAWVSTLYSFIVGGASLLLLVPGILTGVWFFACAYLVVAEDSRGMDALLKSKALVDGRFGPVLGRLFLVWLLGIVLGMIPLIGPIFSLLVAPFSMLYSVVLYRNLSETAGTFSYSATDGTKAAWLLFGLAGYLLVPILIFTLMGAAFFSHFQPLFNVMMKNARKGNQIQLVIPDVGHGARLRSLPGTLADTAR
jgi:hypothetical protein